jgi:arginyl-tRNA synthetase
MDPIIALGLASNILTFVDYATKIMTGTYEVYKSVTGTTEENAHIDTIIGDLRKVTDDLDSDLVGETKHERALKELASKCEKLSDELLRLLEKLIVSGNHSTWKSLKVKIKSMRKEKELAGMEKRLGEYRSQILLRLTLMLK